MAIHLDVSQLNIVIAILGFFVAAFGIISVKFKNHWFLGEACKSDSSLLHAI